MREEWVLVRVWVAVHTGTHASGRNMPRVSADWCVAVRCRFLCTSGYRFSVGHVYKESEEGRDMKNVIFFGFVA